VVSVPCYFSEEQKAALTAAAKQADLTIVRMIKDPTAAAMAYGLDDPATKAPGSKKVAVMDFGGGTCSAAVLSVDAGGVMTLLSHDADTNLGGAEMTHKLMEHFVGTFERKTKVH
jgi:molecular chaperone DnaK (HSP70)